MTTGELKAELAKIAAQVPALDLMAAKSVIVANDCHFAFTVGYFHPAYGETMRLADLDIGDLAVSILPNPEINPECGVIASMLICALCANADEVVIAELVGLPVKAVQRFVDGSIYGFDQTRKILH